MTQEFTKFNKLLLKTLLLAIISIIPNILFSEQLKIHTWANTSIKKSFPSRIMQDNLDISTTGFQLIKSSKKITSKIQNKGHKHGKKRNRITLTHSDDPQTIPTK